MKKIIYVLAILMLGGTLSVNAQYNFESVGKNRIYVKETIEEEMIDGDGEVIRDDKGVAVIQKREVEVLAAPDKHGNADGIEYDLATDGAFEGNTIAVLHLYTGGGFDFSLPKAALEQKGFSVFRWINQPPSAKELEEQLKNACQLWVISDSRRLLNDDHAEVIKDFFESGKGLYIWGDNEPYYADANFLTQKIFGTTMEGNAWADKTVGISGEAENRAGIVDGHLISTGVATVYEGHTVATVAATQDLSPLIYGSGDNLVTAVFEKDGKRAIIDGGFTRLYHSWDTAGTGRYVKNAAAWLVNYERFGELVYDEEKKEEKLNLDIEYRQELKLVIEEEN